MSRVIRASVIILAASWTTACAPSVPRSPEEPPDRSNPLDANADRASAIAGVDAATGNNTARDAGKDNASADTPARDATPDLPPAGDAPADRADTPRPRDATTADAAADAKSADGKPIADADDAATAPDLATEVADDAAPSPTRLPVAGDLKIDELLINPASTDTSREWIEVANLSGAVLDLSSLHVADAAGEVAVDAGLLLPDALLVLGQSLDPARNGGAPIAVSFGNTISLNNPGDTIRLCLGACADGVLLDEVTWTADLGAAFDGHAAIVGAGDAGAATFCPAADAFGTAGSFGSPGQQNPPCP